MFRTAMIASIWLILYFFFAILCFCKTQILGQGYTKEKSKGKCATVYEMCRKFFFLLLYTILIYCHI